MESKEDIPNNSEAKVNSTWHWGDENEKPAVSSSTVDEVKTFTKISNLLEEDLNLQIKALEEYSKKTKK